MVPPTWSSLLFLSMKFNLSVCRLASVIVLSDSISVVLSWVSGDVGDVVGELNDR